MKDLAQFTNLYSKSKTLRFELVPVGETLEHIQKKGIISEDVARAESYKEMKKTIDEFHKDFIDRALCHVKLAGLEEFNNLYTSSSNDKKTDAWKKCRESLRKEIVKAFKLQDDFSLLNKKELIQSRLKEWIDATDPSLYYDEAFQNFTTYFTGYNENRMNMYSDEEKASAISYRLIDENLPKFIDNIGIFQKVKETEVACNFAQICKDMEPWLNVFTLDEVFCLPYYNDVLTQSAIDAYNVLIGGYRDEKTKKQGINEYISLYNQTHPTAKLPNMKMLYKQILSDRGNLSWLPEAFNNSNEMLDAISSLGKSLPITFDNLQGVLNELPQRNAEKIYVSKDALGSISNYIFGTFRVFFDAMHDAKAKDYYSLAELQQLLDDYVPTVDTNERSEMSGYSADCIIRYFSTAFSIKVGMVNDSYAKIKEMLHTNHDEKETLTQNEKDGLKVFLDSAMDAVRVIKPLYLPANSKLEQDALFYGSFDPLYEQDEVQALYKIYDMVRNFVTKKPYSTEKVKLNFECSTLLDGWDVNKETQNLGVLFCRGNKYYLGIMDKHSNHAFEDVKECGDEDCYDKVQYKLLPGPNKMLPKVFFSKSRIDEFAPSEEVLRIYSQGTFKKGDTFNLSDCHTLIDFFKASIEKHSEWRQFNFAFSPTKQYNDISEFYREISEQAYKLTYKPISVAYIENLVHEGKLYLFQIYNKDFSEYSKGKPNLHTMYWRALFDEQNMKDVVYKLNGQAEIFYRKSSIAKENQIMHKANLPIAKKNPVLEGQNSTFAYDLIKDRRYTVDKFQFHVPITMNYKAYGTQRMNEQVCAYLKNNSDINIIGIDRGERNLLYISVIDRNGKVLQDDNGKYLQYSLNTITGSYLDREGQVVPFSTPYHDILDQKESERENARENWGTIENIKELKTGYLSQVVHHIATLMVKYNAVVVMEDLNSGFKRGRFKVEKQVYQNFEKALIEKLNYLVFKNIAADQTGGLYHALQLSEEFKGFKYLTKQSGFIFYVPAWNTSKIDPVTGFVDLLKPKYTNIKDAKEFFGKFKAITYRAEKDYFVFSFDYDDFTEKATGTRTQWDVCTYGALRYAFNKRANNNLGGYEKCNVTEELKRLFADNGIDYRAGDLKKVICATDNTAFFSKLIKLLQVVLAMRYSCAADGKDFILSPVADQNSSFYCSEVCAGGLPQDADANGAYNIARKGLCVLKQIDKAEKYADWSTKISNKEWLAFVQQST